MGNSVGNLGNYFKGTKEGLYAPNFLESQKYLFFENKFLNVQLNFLIPMDLKKSR